MTFLKGNVPFNKGIRTKPAKICLICKKFFYVGRYTLKIRRSEFCSQKCASIDKKTGKNLNCPVCNKEFYCPKYRLRRIKGSPVCSFSCAKIFSRKNPALPRNTRHPNWNPFSHIKRACLICGNIFERKAKVIRRNQRLGKKEGFCSKRCRAIWQNPQQGCENTLIERITEAWLIKHRVSYQKQKILNGIKRADFFILPNIVLECDGDYWHSSEKARIKDECQNSKLLSLGYKVIRLSETAIKKGIFPNLEDLEGSKPRLIKI